MNPTFQARIRRFFAPLIALALLGTVVQANAGTIVRVSTSIGDYSIELLDDIAPVTVQNFLGYVNRNDYNGTYLHRVVDDFVVQGGAYRFQEFFGPVDIPVQSAIPNEFSASNLRGTVAMAKIDGQPDSATNQWFVNLVDNVELDTVNGGFTVFGNVLGAGMTILDGIDDLPTINLEGPKAISAPFITPQFSSGLEFVYMTVEVTQRFSEAPHVYETESGLLITSVNVNNGEELLAINFNTVASEPEVVIQANLESLIRRRDSYTGIATYSTTDNRLRIPTLEVNQNGSVFVLNNVVFALTDPALSRFTLESYDQ